MAKRASSAKLRVAFVGQEVYFKCHYETDLDSSYETFCLDLKWHADETYFQPLIDFRPDITIFFRGELVPPGITRRLKGIKVAISTEPMPKLIGSTLHYTKDSLMRLRFFLSIFEREYDYILHYDITSKSFFESQGINVSGFIPLPIATETYKPLTPLAPQREILFIGRSSDHRERFLGALKRDFDVFHIAHGWPPPGKTRNIRRDFLPLIGNFKIVLNLHAEPELSWEPRLQLMMACGALVVSEPISENEYLKPGVHFLEAATPQSLYELCKELLAFPEKYRDIAKTATEHVRTRLNAKLVFDNIVQNSMSRAYPSPSFSQISARLDLLEMAAEYPGFEHLVREAILRHA